MSSRRRLVYPLAALAAIGALGWWLVADSGDDSGRRREASSDPGPRYYANQASLRSYTADGALDTRVRAQRFEYNARTDVWHLNKPQWRRREDTNTRPWQGRAERGRLMDNESRAVLRGDVRLATPGQHGPIRVYTDYLALYLPRDYAETDQPVRIEARHWQHSGTGGRFWLAEERFNLLADAEGIYAEP